MKYYKIQTLHHILHLIISFVPKNKKFKFVHGKLLLLQYALVKMNEAKKHQARNILETLKLRLINILWNNSQLGYNNEHMLIPWLQQEAEYAIKELKLPEEDEQYYLIRIEQIIGEYIEE